jgi:hypothetical protein
MATPKYRAAERIFIHVNNSQEACLIERGTEFEYSSKPGRNFIPLNDEAAAAVSLIEPLTLSQTNIAPRRGDPGP